MRQGTPISARYMCKNATSRTPSTATVRRSSWTQSSYRLTSTEQPYSSNERARIRQYLISAIRSGSNRTPQIPPCNARSCVRTVETTPGTIDHYNHAITLNPTNEEALRGRGYARLNEHDYDQAIADLTTAISLNPQEALPLIEREERQDSGCGAVDILLLGSALLTSDAGGSTRVGAKRVRNGKIKEVNYAEILQALVFASQAMGEPAWLNAASRIARFRHW